MANEWDAFPRVDSQPSSMSEWDAFPRAKETYSEQQEQPQPTQEDFAKQTLDEMPWLQRQAVSAGGAMMKGYEGVKGLLGGEVDPDVAKYADVAAKEAPVGAFVGEMAKYAPILPLTGIRAAMAGGAALGAAYDPTGKRISSGLMEGAFSGAGAAVGKALPYVVGGAKNVGNALREGLGGAPADRYYGSLDRTREAMQKLIGADAPRASAALGQAGDVTTAQALADLPDAGRRMAVLDEIAKSERGIQAAANPLEAEAARANQLTRQKTAQQSALDSMSMSGSAEETARNLSLMGKQLESNLGPLRQSQLGSANIGGIADDLLKKADELDYQAMNFGGTSAEAANLRKQAQQIKDWGYSPLDVSPIIGKISSVIDDPKLGSSENVTRVMQDVAGGITEWVKKGGGTIDANALYMKRKEAVNEAVGKLLAGADPSVTKKLSAKLTSELKPMIDDAIEASGATGWKEYISQYAKGFKEMEQVELAGALRQLPEAEFMRVMRGDNPELVAKYGDWKTIKEALGANYTKASGVAGEMVRDKSLKEMTGDKSTVAAVEDVIANKSFTRHLPNLLNRYVMIANTALQRGEMEVNKGMYREIEKAMRDPQAMLRLIDMLPPEQRSKMIGYAATLGKGGNIAGAATGEMMQ